MSPKTVRFKTELWHDGFVTLPNAILFKPKLSAQAMRLWAALATYAWEKEECWPGQERLGKQLGISQKTIHNGLRELERHGLLETKRRGLGKTNLYTLVVPDGSESSNPTTLDPSNPTREVDEVEVDEEEKEHGVPLLSSKVLKVWGHYREVRAEHVKGSTQPEAPPVDEARMIRDALKAFEGDPAPLCKSIDGLFGSDFHQQRGSGKKAGRRHTRLSDCLRAKRGGSHGSGYTLRERIEFFCDLRDDQLRGKRKPVADDWHEKSLREQGL